MIISILNEKGGVGKTTLAINLARAFKLFGFRTLLVDSDRQGSSRDWHENGGGESLDVIGLDRPTLDKDITKFKKNYDVIFIDGGPGVSDVMVKALICSDVVLIPAQPAQFDVWTSSSLVDLIKQRQEVTGGKPKAAFVITREILKTRLSKNIEESLRDYEMPIFKNRTSSRVAYIEVIPHGKTVLESEDEAAKHEILALANELIAFCGLTQALNFAFASLDSEGKMDVYLTKDGTPMKITPLRNAKDLTNVNS